MARSVEREGLFGGTYTEHYDDDGNKIGESREQEGLFGGTYTEHYDNDYNSIGESREQEGLFGGTYTEHYDDDYNSIGESREQEGLFGNKYTEHTGTGWSGDHGEALSQDSTSHFESQVDQQAGQSYYSTQSGNYYSPQNDSKNKKSNSLLKLILSVFISSTLKLILLVFILSTLILFYEPAYILFHKLWNNYQYKISIQDSLKSKSTQSPNNLQKIRVESKSKHKKSSPKYKKPRNVQVSSSFNSGSRISSKNTVKTKVHKNDKNRNRVIYQNPPLKSMTPIVKDKEQINSGRLEHDYIKSSIKSALSGDSKAQHYIAQGLFWGDDFVKDNDKAIYWFHQADHKTNFDAKLWLGCFYYLGLGVPKDKKYGISLIDTSAKLGWPYARETLDILRKYDGQSVKDMPKSHCTYIIEGW